MATKQEEMQRFFRYYKEQTGEKEVDMKDVAKLAAANGWPLPPPVDGIARLAKAFRDAVREETRYDQVTGRPYRANHAIPKGQSYPQLYSWIDIDEVEERSKMHKSLVLRREQMVGDAYHLTLDQDHWNRIHPEEEPIQLPLDLQPDVDWRKNGPEELAS